MSDKFWIANNICQAGCAVQQRVAVWVSKKPDERQVAKPEPKKLQANQPPGPAAASLQTTTQMNREAYVDESLGAHKEIGFNAGTHRDEIRMPYDDFVRLGKPRFSRVSEFAACPALSAGRMARSGTKAFLRCRFLSSLGYALQEYATPLLQETEGEAKERQQAMPAPV